MHTAVINTADTEFDGPGDSVRVNQWQKYIEASLDWHCVMIELKQIRRIPIQNLLFAGKESANQLSIGQYIQHCMVGSNILNR